MNKSYKLECGYHTWMSLITYYTGVTGNNVDVVAIELHDCFSTNELIAYEALVSYPTELQVSCLPPLDLYITDSVMYRIYPRIKAPFE